MKLEPFFFCSIPSTTPISLSPYFSPLLLASFKFSFLFFTLSTLLHLFPCVRQGWEFSNFFLPFTYRLFSFILFFLQGSGAGVPTYLISPNKHFHAGRISMLIWQSKNLILVDERIHSVANLKIYL